MELIIEPCCPGSPTWTDISGARRSISQSTRDGVVRVVMNGLAKAPQKGPGSTFEPLVRKTEFALTYGFSAAAQDRRKKETFGCAGGGYSKGKSRL